MLDFPNTPNVGDTLELDGITWVWDGVKWAHPEGASTGSVPRISTGQFPPASPSPGDLWFDPVEGQLYIWFDDGTSSQWVVTINQGGGGGGGGWPAMGVIDGSNAQPGEVGETVTNPWSLLAGQVDNSGMIMSASGISLTAGDWIISSYVNFILASGNVTNFTAIMETILYAENVARVVHTWGTNQTIRSWQIVLPTVRWASATSIAIDLRLGTMSDASAATNGNLTAVRIR